jgi:hypothetical protein
MTISFWKSLRRRTARFVTLIPLLGTTAALGCSPPSSPSSETRYVLAKIAGVELPAPFDVFRDNEGNLRSLEMVKGRLTLLPDGTFHWDLSAVRKLNGEVVESLTVKTNGQVEREGQKLILRYPSGAGYEERVDYEVLENGRQLSGPHSTGRVYGWIREDAAP